MNRRGFTLVELLVVVGIIAVLLSIILPSLIGATRAARTMICMNQLKQIGTATAIYAEANDDYLPFSTHSALSKRAMPWGYALMPYLGYPETVTSGPDWESLFNGLYRCPEDERRREWSYGKNVWFELTPPESGEIEGKANGPVYHRLPDIRHPSRTILIAELASGSMADHVMAHFWHFGASHEVAHQRHGSTSNYLFVDTHVETRSFESTFNLPELDLWHPGRAQ